MSPKIVKILNRNNDYQRIEVLKRNREKRTKYKEFFVEGVKSLNRLLSHGWPVHAFIYPSDKGLSDWAKTILKQSKASIHYEMPYQLMAQLSDKEETSELLAIVPMPEEDLSRIKLHDKLLVVIFDRPSSYGNLGTIMRTCDSFRVDGLILTGHSVDLYDPQTIRASVGSLFAFPVVRMPSHKELLPWLKQVGTSYGGFSIVGTDERAMSDIESHDFTGPTAFVLGNETDGMSRAYQDLCDETVMIPLYGSATSLNVACAASIVLYEIDRQRRKN